MLFYVQNLENEHWALQVAVNPMEMIRRVTTSNVPQGQDRLIHGYFYIDPMDKANRDGKIPSRKNLKDSKLRNCELIFLLNYMSRYRDMHAHNLLDNYMYQDSLEYLWAMGSIGPFGMVFLEGEMDWFNVIGKHHFELIFPQLLAPKKTFPTQSDGYNCGVFVILTIMDFVVTQWNKQWRMNDLSDDGLTLFGLTNWDNMIHNYESIRIPQSYNIGTAFVEDNKTCSAQTYKRLCDYIRMESVILMERIHCIFYEAFSNTDQRVETRILGVARDEYWDAIKDDPVIMYVRRNLFREALWPTMEDYAYLAMAILLNCGNTPAVFLKNYYINEKQEDMILENFTKTSFLPIMSGNITDDSTREIDDVVKLILTKRINTTQEEQARISGTKMTLNKDVVVVPETPVAKKIKSKKPVIKIQVGKKTKKSLITEKVAKLPPIQEDTSKGIVTRSRSRTPSPRKKTKGKLCQVVS